jgi:hypothetical protein
MPFGQVVVGPPGSGKTTYCHGVAEFMRAAGRKVAIVNLDPANDGLPYKPAVDVSELICLEEVMDQLRLGPNGGAWRGTCCRPEEAVAARARCRAALASLHRGAQQRAGLRFRLCAGLLYCIAFLAQNLDWLAEKLEPLEKGAPLQDAQRRRPRPAAHAPHTRHELCPARRAQLHRSVHLTPA